MHQIENEFLKVRAREYGAELTSIFDKKNKIEHLWQADPKFWEWHSPVLFPVVGRCLNDEITVGKEKYQMGKHGFARKSNFKLLELSENKMVFSLLSNEETLKSYPYKFEFLIGYRLKDNSLVVSYEVVNEDDKTIYFSIGGHPGFAVPFLPDEKYEDYYLELEQTENSPRHYINEEGFFDGRRAQALDDSNRIDLQNGLFKDDALIFKDLKSRKVSIRSKNHAHSLSVDFKGFGYLGVWAKNGAPYVCIEPWMGCADTVNQPAEFKNKEGIISLEKGGEFNVSYSIGLF